MQNNRQDYISAYRDLYIFEQQNGIQTMISGSMSPQHSASSGCSWRNGFQYRR